MRFECPTCYEAPCMILGNTLMSSHEGCDQASETGKLPERQQTPFPEMADQEDTERTSTESCCREPCHMPLGHLVHDMDCSELPPSSRSHTVGTGDSELLPAEQLWEVERTHYLLCSFLRKENNFVQILKQASAN